MSSIEERSRQKFNELKAQFGTGAKYVALEVLDNCKRLKDSVNFEEEYIFWTGVIDAFREEAWLKPYDRRVLVIGSGPGIGTMVSQHLGERLHEQEILVINTKDTSLKGLATDLLQLTEKEVEMLRQVERTIPTVSPEVVFEIKNISHDQVAYLPNHSEKKLSQQGWKNRPKHRR